MSTVVAMAVAEFLRSAVVLVGIFRWLTENAMRCDAFEMPTKQKFWWGKRQFGDGG